MSDILPVTFGLAAKAAAGTGAPGAGNAPATGTSFAALMGNDEAVAPPRGEPREGPWSGGAQGRGDIERPRGERRDPPWAGGGTDDGIEAPIGGGRTTAGAAAGDGVEKPVGDAGGPKGAGGAFGWLALGAGGGVEAPVAPAEPPAGATSGITYRAVLPSEPAGGLLDAGLAGADIAADDEAAFLAGSLEGGRLTIRNGAGETAELVLRWAKTGDEPASWSLYYLSDADAEGEAARWTRVPADFVFDADGALREPAGTGVALAALSVGGADFGDVTLSFGENGLRQAADAAGQVRIAMLGAHGAGTGASGLGTWVPDAGDETQAGDDGTILVSPGAPGGAAGDGGEDDGGAGVIPNAAGFAAVQRSYLAAALSLGLGQKGIDFAG